MADQGMFINVEATDMTNLPKQQMQPRKLLRSKSLVNIIFKFVIVYFLGSTYIGKVN
jgi:hypothetical protein